MSIIERSIDRARRQAVSPVAPELHVGNPLRPDAPQASGDFRGASATRPRLQLDTERLRAVGLRGSPTDESIHAGQYRALRRRLVDRAFNSSSTSPKDRLLIVASSLSGEGKTFTSFNLALSLAREPDKMVLLIDGDLPKRDLTHALALDDARGFSDGLRLGSPGLEEMIFPTSVERLWVMPAGLAWREASDALGTEPCRNALMALLSSYPHLIIVADSGPLLLSSEAEILAREAGHLLLVVRAGHTEQGVLKDAVGLVDERVPTSLILNAWEPSLLGEAPYYGRYYGTIEP